METDAGILAALLPAPVERRPGVGVKPPRPQARTVFSFRKCVTAAGYFPRPKQEA